MKSNRLVAIAPAAILPEFYPTARQHHDKSIDSVLMHRLVAHAHGNVSWWGVSIMAQSVSMVLGNYLTYSTNIFSGYNAVGSELYCLSLTL